MPFIFEKAYHGETPLESEIRGKKKKNFFLRHGLHSPRLKVNSIIEYYLKKGVNFLWAD